MTEPSSQATSSTSDDVEVAQPTAVVAGTETTANTEEGGGGKQEEETVAMGDEDDVMFGSMAATIADTLADRIDVALVERISSLPVVASTSSKDDDGGEGTGDDNTASKTKGELLLHKLQQKYLKNVDIVEVYAQRNIFTCSMYPPRRRQRILQAYLQRQQEEQGKGGQNETTTIETTGDGEGKSSPAATEKSVTTDTSTSGYKCPSREQIPTSEAVEEINKEMEELQEKLKAARIRRNELIVACKSIEVAEQAAKKSLESLSQCEKDNEGDAAAVDQVHGKVTAALMGHQGLHQLGEEGRKLMTKLDTLKRERDDEGYINENVNPADEVWVDLNANSVAPSSKRSKTIKTLEEQYDEDRQQVQTNAQSLNAIHKLLNPNAS